MIKTTYSFPIIQKTKRRTAQWQTVFLFFCLLLAGIQAHAVDSAGAPGDALTPIRSYISSAWDVLTRSMTRCDSIADPKLATTPVLYLPAGLPPTSSVQKLEKDCKVEVEHLPAEIHRPGEMIQ